VLCERKPLWRAIAPTLSVSRVSGANHKALLQLESRFPPTLRSVLQHGRSSYQRSGSEQACGVVRCPKPARMAGSGPACHPAWRPYCELGRFGERTLRSRALSIARSLGEELCTRHAVD